MCFQSMFNYASKCFEGEIMVVANPKHYRTIKTNKQ